MPRFTKLPVEIEAEQNLPQNRFALVQFLGPDNRNIGWSLNERTGHGFITTLEGVMKFKPGDWLVKGVAGEFYPVDQDIFARIYIEVPFFREGFGDDR